MLWQAVLAVDVAERERCEFYLIIPVLSLKSRADFLVTRSIQPDYN